MSDFDYLMDRLVDSTASPRLLGEVVYRLRKNKGLTTDELSEVSHVEPYLLMEIERGINCMSYEVRGRLISAFTRLYEVENG